MTNTKRATDTIAMMSDMLFASVPYGQDIHAEMRRAMQEAGIGEEYDADRYMVAHVYQGTDDDRMLQLGTEPGNLAFYSRLQGAWIVGVEPASAAAVHEAARRIVGQDVRYCVSGLIATLIKGACEPDAILDDDDAATLSMCAPGVDEYRDTADYDDDAKGIKVECVTDDTGTFWRWSIADDDGDEIDTDDEDSEIEAWRAAFESARIDTPDGREIFEHWLVTEWLADQLEERGESVVRDVEGLTVWGRSTTGQAICMDSVLQDIARAVLEA